MLTASDATASLAARTRAMIGVVALCWTGFAIRAATVSRRVLLLNAAGALVSAALFFAVRAPSRVARGRRRT